MDACRVIKTRIPPSADQFSQGDGIVAALPGIGLVQLAGPTLEGLVNRCINALEAVNQQAEALPTFRPLTARGPLRRSTARVR